MNGINMFFVVETVMDTSGSSKFQRDKTPQIDHEQKRQDDNSLFAEILGAAIKEYH